MKNREFETATKTRKGYVVKDVEWHKKAKVYQGLVDDPILKTERHPWVTCHWDRKGRCVNKGRADCDLVLPEASARKTK